MVGTAEREHGWGGEKVALKEEEVRRNKRWIRSRRKRRRNRRNYRNRRRMWGRGRGRGRGRRVKEGRSED